MSKQVSLFKFFGGTSKRNVSIQSTQRNDNAEVKAVLNNLLKKVVENERKEKKPDADFSYSNRKIKLWKERFTFWETVTGKVCFSCFVCLLLDTYKFRFNHVRVMQAFFRIMLREEI